MRFEHPIRAAAGRARVDRGDGLYLADGPREGFLCAPRGTLFSLTPGEALIEAFAEWMRPQIPRDGPCVSLMRLSGGEADDLPLLLAGIRLLDLGASEAMIRGYIKRVRQRAAVCLRQKAGGGRLWLCLACAHLALQGLTKQ